jgi:uncharacterized membrane protein
MKNSYEFRKLAREQLKNSYWMLLLATFIVAAVPGATSMAIVGFVILGPLVVGESYLLLDVIDNNSKGDRLEFLFEGFKKSFLNSFLAELLSKLFIFLWSLLFIIPGVIKFFSYKMVPYIIAENPDIDAIAAITLSREMMNGHKFRLFKLYLSFIGWVLLSILTLGIGLILLLPYVKLSVANFYRELKPLKKVMIEE